MRVTDWFFHLTLQKLAYSLSRAKDLVPCKLTEALSCHSLSHGNLHFCFKEQHTNGLFKTVFASRSSLCPEEQNPCAQPRLEVPRWELKEVWELHVQLLQHQQHWSDWGKINKWRRGHFHAKGISDRHFPVPSWDKCVCSSSPKMLIAPYTLKSTFQAASCGATRLPYRDFCVPNTAEMPYTKFCVIRIDKCKEDLDTNKYLAGI